MWLVLGPWGLLPIVVPAFAFVASRLGTLAYRGEGSPRSDRAVAGVVLAFACVVVAVRGLSLVSLVTTAWLAFGLLTLAALLALVPPRPSFSRASLGSLPLDPQLSLVALVLLAALGLACLAARWLPVWQWDSLGYHLPFVHFTLAAKSVAGVPRELVYIGTYPHVVEMFFVALRACLPDDRLIDLGQVPFGLAGAVVTAALARSWKASREMALVAGAAWLLMPAVFLQLPTNYVDVATATFALAAVYFVLAPLTPRSVLLTGVALGLFVGSKPSAPVPASLLFAVLLVRSWRARLPAGLMLVLGSGALVVLLGGESYLQNLKDHANPVWPVTVDLGPLHFPGKSPISELLAAGANAPRLHGPLPWRFLRSLVSLAAPPVFDMRIGGFGPLLLLAIPFAVLWLVRERRPALVLALLSCLVSPDPAVARYILAFPALLFAAAAAGAPLPSRTGSRLAVFVAVAVLGAVELAYAAPGLIGDGPPLAAYASMSDGERAVAVGADGPPTTVAAARARVGPDEAFAFDENMDLCDMAWDERQSYRVVLLEEALLASSVGERIDKDRIRVLAVGDAAPAGAWARSHPLQFERLSALPSCRTGTCSLFVRR